MKRKVTDIDGFREDGSVQRIVVFGGSKRAMSTVERCYQFDFRRFVVVGERIVNQEEA